MISEARNRHNKERRTRRDAAEARRALIAVERKEAALQPSRPMNAGPIRVTTALVAHSVPVGDTSDVLVCPVCSDVLSLHQPDEDQPEFLLGICNDCSKWLYIVEPDSGSGQALMIELPGRDFISYVQALAQNLG